ncbi:DUF465 domain-containing protein [Desulfovibrionales bacterium]
MEQSDLDLLEKFRYNDSELNALWEEHQLYEKQLKKLAKKVFILPDEDRMTKEIKKKKLSGKTKIQVILDRYKAMGN